MILVVQVLVFMTFFLLVLSVDFVLRDRKVLQKERLLQALKDRPAAGRGGVLQERLARVAERGLAALRFIDLTGVKYLIKSAHSRLSLERFCLLSCLFCIAGAAVPPLLSITALLSPVSAAAGLLVPYLYLRMRRSRNEEALVRQMPEAIESITRGLRAGQSVDSAIREVANTFPAPLGIEFREIRQGMAMGLPFEAVLDNFMKRFPRVPEVRILAVTFLIERETGGNLTIALGGLSGTVRERLRLKRQVKASTAEGRATAMVLGFLPVGFGIVTWMMRPAYIRVFFDRPLGQKLFVAALLMEVTAIFLMRVLSRFRI
jgi:tight adherence protein B